MVGAKMDAIFKATAIAHTKPTANGNSGELTLSDATGRKLTIDIGDGLARDLLSALQHLVERPSRTGPAATKMPKGFAVGTARYEPVVLVRFENDTPYGLHAADAAELGRALVEHAESVEFEGVPARQ